VPRLPLWRLLPLLALAVCGALLSGCGDDKPLVRYENTPPQIVSLSADPDTIGRADTVRIVCDAVDPNPDQLRYRWSADAGGFLPPRPGPGADAVSWVSPDSAGTAHVTVTVSDGVDSTSATASILVLGAIGWLEGTVRDSDGAAPLAGAQIRIGGATATSGEDGRYRVNVLPPGVHTLQAGLAGYQPYETTIPIAEGANAHDIELVRVPLTARLHGRVTNALDQPVAGAVARAGGIEMTTGADGEYELIVPRVAQTLEVRRESYALYRETVEIAEPEVLHDVVLDAETPRAPQGLLTATEAGAPSLLVRVDWEPDWDNPTIVAYELHVWDNETGPSAVGGASFGPDGGSHDFVGLEDHRYRFAVRAVNFEEETGLLSPASAVVVLTAPSPLAPIAAEPFVMGDYPDGWGNQDHPGNPVSVGSFGIETHEVTNRQYLAFLLEAYDRDQVQMLIPTGAPDPIGIRAGADTLLLFAGSQIDPDPARILTVVSGREDYPVAGVTWQGARHYALSIGRRLPTEAEWEKAARGTDSAAGTWPGTEIGVGAMYPWGMEAPASQRANFGGTQPGPRAVGSYPLGAAVRGGVAVHDLAGNVAEWCADWLGAYLDPHNPPGSGAHRIVRGGHYGSGSAASAPELRAAHRGSQRPGIASPTLGFRCVE